MIELKQLLALLKLELLQLLLLARVKLRLLRAMALLFQVQTQLVRLLLLLKLQALNRLLPRVGAQPLPCQHQTKHTKQNRQCIPKEQPQSPANEFRARRLSLPIFPRACISPDRPVPARSRMTACAGVRIFGSPFGIEIMLRRG